MNTLIILLIIVVTALLILRYTRINEMFENDILTKFNTGDNIYLMTNTGLFAEVNNKKEITFTKNRADASLFTINKLSDNLVSLRHSLMYMKACYGNANCSDIITVDSFSPNAINSKIVLEEQENASYLLQFYDGKYFTVDLDNIASKTYNKDTALKIIFISAK